MAMATWQAARLGREKGLVNPLARRIVGMAKGEGSVREGSVFHMEFCGWTAAPIIDLRAASQP
jgi:hypothetical protein